MLPSRAQAFAARVHGGQLYGTADYTEGHLRPVAEAVRAALDAAGWTERREEVEAAAWLHDTVEDGRATLAEIESEFGRSVAVLVDLLTRPAGTEYLAYVRRLAENRAARLIKRADVGVNLNACEAPDAPPEKRGLARRYRAALVILGES